MPKNAVVANDVLTENDVALPILLLRARAAVSRRFRGAMRRHGISEQQFRILRALEQKDRMDVKALARRTDLLPSSLSRILRDLDARGLVRRMPGDDDARRTLAIIRSAGRALVARAMIDVAIVRDEVEAEIGRDSVARLRTELIALLNVLDREDGDPDDDD